MTSLTSFSTLTKYPDIESALHQTKRRFTDFVFQRVSLGSKDVASVSSLPGSPHPEAQRQLRSPRSASSLQAPKSRAARTQSSTGVPQVRATSPGAEIREAQRVAAAAKEAEEKRRRALTRGPVPFGVVQTVSDTEIPPATRSGERSGAPATPSSSRARSLRRFQISRSSSPSLGSLRSSAGIQKRRTDGATPGVAVLVEQLRRTPHSRRASLVADFERAQADGTGAISTSELASVSPVKPRKRPVVNQAEKKWREERQGAISAAKQHLSETLEKSAQANHSTWDEETERLAREFQQVALEIEQGMELDHGESPVQPPPPPQFKPAPAKPLKVQPRLPKEPRTPRVQSQSAQIDAGDATEPTVEGHDDDYVYDVYIRRPIAESDMLTNPLAEFESEQRLKQLEAAHHGIGIIVITAEDEEYWEHFVEDDEEEWDSEDADSNGKFFLSSLPCPA